MKRILLLIPLIFFLSCGEPETEVELPEPEISHHDMFFNNMLALCGQQFQGEMVYPEDDEDHDFYGHTITMIVESCSQDEIRIPLHVGDNTSRTWVITRVDEGLLLKHDHRHEDGTPEDLSNYGGYADDTGTAYRQSFPADAETAEMLPEAETNIWTMIIDEENGLFIYDLQRHGQPRFRAEIALN